MGSDPSAPAGPEAGRLNTRLALLMFCAVAAPCLVLSAMANDARVQDAIHRVCWWEATWKKQIPIYCFYDHYLDSDDKLVHEELPAADFSRGSVCLLGASSLNWGLNLWELPESTRRLIHNFAMRGHESRGPSRPDPLPGRDGRTLAPAAKRPSWCSA